MRDSASSAIGDGYVMELAAHVRHARGLNDLVAVKLLIAAVAIGMHHAAEVSEVVCRMRALAVGAIVIDNSSGSGILIPAAIEDIDPDSAGFRLAPPRVENIDRGYRPCVFGRPRRYGL